MRARSRPRPLAIRAAVAVAVAVSLMVVSPAACSAGSNARRSADGSNATVERVVDGDTIVARISGRSEKIRMIGFNTPETVDPRRPVECFGPEASARLKHLLTPHAAIRLERDAEGRDVYGRLLAYVYRSSDGLFVNLAMVADGYARVLTIAPNDAYADRFRSAEGEARRERLGLWSACPATGS